MKPRLFTPGAVKAEQVAARLLVGRLAPEARSALGRGDIAVPLRGEAPAGGGGAEEKYARVEGACPRAGVSAVVRRGRRASGGPGEQLRPPAPWEASTELSTLARILFSVYTTAPAPW